MMNQKEKRRAERYVAEKRMEDRLVEEMARRAYKAQYDAMANKYAPQPQSTALRSNPLPGTPMWGSNPRPSIPDVCTHQFMDVMGNQTTQDHYFSETSCQELVSQMAGYYPELREIVPFRRKRVAKADKSLKKLISMSL